MTFRRKCIANESRLITKPMTENEQTLELCNMILAHLASIFRKDDVTEPSINAIAVLASEIKEELKKPVEESDGESDRKFIDWCNPDANGNIDVPDDLVPLLNKLAHHLRCYTISGESEAMTLCRMVAVAEKYFIVPNASRQPTAFLLNRVQMLKAELDLISDRERAKDQEIERLKKDVAYVNSLHKKAVDASTECKSKFVNVHLALTEAAAEVERLEKRHIYYFDYIKSLRKSRRKAELEAYAATEENTTLKAQLADVTESLEIHNTARADEIKRIQSLREQVKNLKAELAALKSQPPTNP